MQGSLCHVALKSLTRTATFNARTIYSAFLPIPEVTSEQNAPPIKPLPQSFTAPYPDFHHNGQ